MKPYTDIANPRVVKALAHPLRIRILGILEQRTASPSEIADELGAPLGNVAYHVRKLANLGFVKLVKKTPRRGAVEHYYRAEARPEIPDSGWGDVPGLIKEAMVDAALGQIGAQAKAAAMTGGFDREDAHLTRTALALDEEGFKQIAAELMSVLAKAEKIEAESGARLNKKDDHEPLRFVLGMLLFEQGPALPDSAPAPTPARRGRASGAV